MLSKCLLKILVYLLIKVFLLTGQFSVRNISAFNLSLSRFTRSQSYNIRSVVCSPILQGHIGLSIVLYLYRYDLILPWLYLKCLKMRCWIPNAYILDITMYKMHASFVIIVQSGYLILKF